MKRLLRAIARILGAPLRPPLGQVRQRVDEAEGATAQRITEARWSIEEVVTRETNVVQGAVHVKIDDVEARLNARLDALERAVGANGETTAELARATTRAVERTREELAAELQRGRAADAIWPLIGRPLADLPEPAAHLINWANSPTGMAGEAGAFVSTGLNIQFREGRAELVEVSERIVELPFARGVIAQLPPGSHVLDVGARESTLALEVASLGHRTVALDPRGYPFEHPRLDVVTAPAEDWDGPAEPFDAVLCVSTIEHLGLGAYVPASAVDELDVVVMRRLRSWTAADGTCVLTVPYGAWSVDDFQRVYDDDHLDRLLDGWKVARRDLYRRVDARTWEPYGGDGAWPDATPGVAMLLLHPA